MTVKFKDSLHITKLHETMWRERERLDELGDKGVENEKTREKESENIHSYSIQS